MDFFLQNYKQMFKPLVSEYGFKSHKRSFYRIKNDVVQYLVLHRWVPFGRSCTIDFDIYPLCIGVDKKGFSSASYDIVQLLGRTNWWEYDPGKEESVLEVVNKMLTATKEYLIPFFEKAVDSASAYEEICNFERKIYTGIPGGIIMHDRVKVCFAIKMGAYDKAVEHLKAIEAQNLAHLSEERLNIVRNSERFKKLQKEIELISLPDMEYINEFIARNEEYSLSNLCRSRKI